MQVLFVMTFGLGLGPVTWLLPAELFPMRKRAAATGLATAVNWLANFAMGQVFLPCLATPLGSYAFVPFSLVLAGGLVFVHRCVPETRGKTLEQIERELGPPRALQEQRQAEATLPDPPATQLTRHADGAEGSAGARALAAGSRGEGGGGGGGGGVCIAKNRAGVQIQIPRAQSEPHSAHRALQLMSYLYFGESGFI